MHLFCVQVKAMRFPPKSYNKDLESAEDRREREAQVDCVYVFVSTGRVCVCLCERERERRKKERHYIPRSIFLRRGTGLFVLSRKKHRL